MDGGPGASARFCGLHTIAELERLLGFGAGARVMARAIEQCHVSPGHCTSPYACAERLSVAHRRGQTRDAAAGGDCTRGAGDPRGTPAAGDGGAAPRGDADPGGHGPLRQFRRTPRGAHRCLARARRQHRRAARLLARAQGRRSRTELRRHRSGTVGTARPAGPPARAQLRESRSAADALRPLRQQGAAGQRPHLYRPRGRRPPGPHPRADRRRRLRHGAPHRRAALFPHPASSSTASATAMRGSFCPSQPARAASTGSWWRSARSRTMVARWVVSSSARLI
jgi:hypothetical protein